MKSNCITLDISAIGRTSLLEIMETLEKEFAANETAHTQFEENAAVASGIALKQIKKYLKSLD